MMSANEVLINWSVIVALAPPTASSYLYFSRLVSWNLILTRILKLVTDPSQEEALRQNAGSNYHFSLI